MVAERGTRATIRKRWIKERGGVEGREVSAESRTKLSVDGERKMDAHSLAWKAPTDKESPKKASTVEKIAV